MTQLADPPPAASRSRRATFTYASMILFTLVTTFTGLVITPWLVSWLGEDRYGAVRVLFEYAGYLSLLELGLGGALSPLLSRALANRDDRSLRDVMAVALRFYGAITLAILTVGFAALPWIPGLVGVGPHLYRDVRWAWAITVLGYLSLAMSPFRALLDAEQRGYVVNNFITIQALGLAILSLAFASTGLGVKGQSLATSLSVGLTMLWMASMTVRRHPASLQGLRQPSDPEARAALRRLSGPALTVNVAGRISLLSDSIIVGLLLGPVRVTILFVTQRLALIAQGQLQGIGSASWAALAELHAQGEHETFNRRLVELTRVIAILGMTVLGPIVAFNSQFVALWLGSSRDGGPLIIVIAAANAMLIAFTSLWLWVFTGTGQIGRVVRPILASAALNLAASVLFTRSYGVVGPLLGTLVAYLAIHTWYLPVMLRRHFGTPLRGLAWAVAAPLLVGVPYAAGLWWLVRGRPTPGWIWLAIEMGASASAFLAFSTAVLLDPTDRAIWRARLAGLLPFRLGKVDG